MKFHDYPSLWSWFSKHGLAASILPLPMQIVMAKSGHRKPKADDFYTTMLVDLGNDPVCQGQALAESDWHTDGRPYYNVWPAVVKPFLRLDLSKVPVNSIHFPVRSLAIRFAETERLGEFDWKGQSYYVRSALVSVFPNSLHPETGKPMPGVKTLLAHIDFGETGKELGQGDDCPVPTWRRFPMREGTTVAESMDAAAGKNKSVSEGIPIPEDLIRQTFQIIAACGLLETDSSVLVPDVLNRDKHKFDPDNPDPVIVARAKRKGKVGWNVGEAMERGETSPHFRVPHPALYHIGPGRKQTVIRFRSGDGKGGPIVVHRDKMTQMPTGRGDTDDQPDPE